MELRELGEPMQETELLVFRRKGPVKSWRSRKVPDKRRSCYFWKKGAWLRYNWYVLCVPRDLWIWRREPGETKVACSLGQDDSPGHKVLEERCLA